MIERTILVLIKSGEGEAALKLLAKIRSEKARLNTMREVSRELFESGDETTALQTAHAISQESIQIDALLSIADEMLAEDRLPELQPSRNLPIARTRRKAWCSWKPHCS